MLQQLLKKLESFQSPSSGQMSFLEMEGAGEAEPQLEVQEASLSAEELELLSELKDLPISALTPLEALNHIAKWQKALN